MKKQSYLVLGLALTTACTAREIISKPRAAIDPAPLAVSTESAGQDPLRDQQWNLRKVGWANDLTAGSSNLRIAVLSTGVDYNHEDLRGRIAVNEVELAAAAPGAASAANGIDDDGNGLVDDIVGWDVVENDGLAFDRRGTGTAMAGVLVARRDNSKGISGMIGDARIFPVRYIDENGQTGVDQLTNALLAAAIFRPNVIVIQAANVPTVTIDPVWGFPIEADTGALDAALSALRDVPVVVGAGNDATLFGEGKIDQILRAHDNVFVVTSSTESDEKAFVANYNGTQVVTSAPGEALLSTKPNNQYGKVSSTAFAATHVAGAIALAIAKVGPQPHDRMLTALVSADGSDRLTSMQNFCLGRNRLNLTKFLSQF